MDADAWLTAFKTVNANMPPNLDPNAVADRFAEDLHIQPLRELPGGPLRGGKQVGTDFRCDDDLRF